MWRSHCDMLLSLTRDNLEELKTRTQELSLKHLVLPIVDGGVPDDAVACRQLIEAIRDSVMAGKKVILHSGAVVVEPVW